MGNSLQNLFRQTSSFSTGIVIANFDENNEAHYDIVQNVAWDFIEILPEHEEIIKNAEAFVLVVWLQETKTSRNTLFQLLEWAKFKIFDVNFRPPFVDVELIKTLLHKCDLVKMNKPEFAQYHRISWRRIYRRRSWGKTHSKIFQY